MKLKKIITLIIFAGSLSQAGVEYEAGQSSFWGGASRVTTKVYPTGDTSFDTVNTESLAKMGYSQTIKSKLSDEWKVEDGTTTGKIVVNRRGPKSYESIVVEGKYDDKNWTDISVFGEENSLIRRTICRDRACFIVSKSICAKMTQAAGVTDVAQAKDIQGQCSNLARAFKSFMDDEKKSNSLDNNFRSDLKKASYAFRERNYVTGADIDANARNLHAYLSACDTMKWFNMRDRAAGAATTPAAPSRTR